MITEYGIEAKSNSEIISELGGRFKQYRLFSNLTQKDIRHLLFPEIHNIFGLIYIEIAILADFFKCLNSYRIFIYYFCHIPTCFTFCAAKLRRNSELAKHILKIIRKRSGNSYIKK